MTTPTRCRQCRARRSLPRHPLDYKRAPVCKQCGGELVVDAYRARKGPKDRAPVCYCWMRPYPHRRDDKGCLGFEDWVLERPGARLAPGAECPF